MAANADFTAAKKDFHRKKKKEIEEKKNVFKIRWQPCANPSGKWDHCKENSLDKTCTNGAY